MNVLFVCIGNSGRSVMAERLFRRAVEGRHEARSAGAAASGTRQLDDEALAWADLAVTVCSYDVCPATPGVRRLGWSIDDPYGRPLDEVRVIRDTILDRVEQLVSELR